jgi:two-component system, NarL family, sensor histidine kinase UhpB
MNEIWDGIVTQLQVGSAIAMALFLLTMLVVNRALAPLQSLSQAMASIEGGAYGTRVKPAGSPELAAICSKLNHLAATLGDAVEEKRQLAEAMVSLQDAERKEIARELHDEFGPYLFALRAHVGALMRSADTSEPNPDMLRRHVDAILDQINALQQFNRRVLERLRPVGLAELGLSEAIGALLRLWNESRPEVMVETTISPSLGETSETAQLTVYRIIQEALTNVFRHAGATHVEITLAPVPSHQTGCADTSVVAVSVSDNGAGLPVDHKQGFGMIGMRERVLALGGSMIVTSTPHGVTVEALVPSGTRQLQAVEAI